MTLTDSLKNGDFIKISSSELDNLINNVILLFFVIWYLTYSTQTEKYVSILVPSNRFRIALCGSKQTDGSSVK